MGFSRLKLRWKLFTYLLGFCAILLLILWLFQTVLLDYFYRNIKVIETKSYASQIADNIDKQNLSDLISGITENGDVSVRIFEENGAVLYSQDFSNNSLFRKMTKQDFNDIISKAKENAGKYIGFVDGMAGAPPEPRENTDSGKLPAMNSKPGQSLLYAKLVPTSSGETAIFVSALISPVNATVTTLRYQLYIITAIMLVLAVLLALLMARRVSKPIEEINSSAKVLAGGNYETQFGGRGFLEINELSDTLNTTATELMKVESLRRELMANISHDLRTPLSLIYSYAEVMHDFPDEITPDQTQVIMDETSRLSALVSDILDISKLESGGMCLNLKEYNLTESISTTVSRVSELIRKDCYTLCFEHEGDFFIRADETKITQVVYNLLINAINYAGSDKTVMVRQLISPGQVKIEISDTGEGIRPEDLPHIWDRYYKVDKNHRRAVTGTGLGLSIVKKIITLHGGEYGVDSAEGMGSTFWFSLKT